MIWAKQLLVWRFRCAAAAMLRQSSILRVSPSQTNDRSKRRKSAREDEDESDSQWRDVSGVLCRLYHCSHLLLYPGLLSLIICSLCLWLAVCDGRVYMLLLIIGRVGGRLASGSRCWRFVGYRQRSNCVGFYVGIRSQANRKQTANPNTSRRW